MMDSILWDNATRDYDAEQHTAQLERARVALAETVPFIVKAASHDEYLDRIALMQDKIETTLRGLASSEAEYVGLFGAVMSSLDEDFNTLRQARRVKAEAEDAPQVSESDDDAPEASDGEDEASEDEGESDEEAEADEPDDDEAEADEAEEMEDDDKKESRRLRALRQSHAAKGWENHKDLGYSSKTVRLDGADPNNVLELSVDYLPDGRPSYGAYHWHVHDKMTDSPYAAESGTAPTITAAKWAAEKAAEELAASRKRANRKVALNEIDLLEVESDGALVFGRSNANRFYRALLAAGIEASEPEFSDMAVGNHFDDDGDEYLTEEETYWISLPAEQVGYEALESIFKSALRKRSSRKVASDPWTYTGTGDFGDMPGLPHGYRGPFFFRTFGDDSEFRGTVWDIGNGWGWRLSQDEGWMNRTVSEGVHSDEGAAKAAVEAEAQSRGISMKNWIASRKRSSRKRAVTIQDVYFPADGNFDASDPIAVFVTDRGNYTLNMEGSDPREYSFPEPDGPGNPYMSGPYYYQVRDEAGRLVGNVSAYGDEYNAPFDEAVYEAEQLLSRLGVRVASVRKAGSRKRAVRKTALRVDDVLPHAIEALWFIGSTFDGEPLDSNPDYSSLDMLPSDERKVRDSLEDFLREAYDLIDEAGLSAEQVGHDFVFSATGQGAGFWDRGLGAVGDELDRIAKRTSQFSEGLYGGDGWVALSSRKRASDFDFGHGGAKPVRYVAVDEDGVRRLVSTDPIPARSRSYLWTVWAEYADGSSRRITGPAPTASRRKRASQKRASRKVARSGFWDAIDAQIEELKSAKSADDVIDILSFDRNPYGPEPELGDAFFAGSGGDKTVWGALMQAGWKFVDHEADYYWVMRAPDGSEITYIEGDIYRGNRMSKSSSRKRATRKTARKPVKGIAIYPDKRVEEVTISSLSDYQSIVGGLIEPVMLSDGSTLYVNEEFLYSFGPDDFNSIATDVAGLGGASHILLSGILGPAILVGPVSNDGYDTDVTSAARAWVNRVAREASVKRRGSRRRTAAPEMWEVRQHDFYTSPTADGHTYMVWGRFDSEDEANRMRWQQDTSSVYSPFEVVRVSSRTAAADFDSWMAKVNAHVQSKVGLSAEDLADQPYYDWFEDGITPAQAARLLLMNEGYTGSRSAGYKPKKPKPKKHARRRTAYNDYTVNPTGDDNYNYDEYNRGRGDGYDDGYNVGANKPNANDRRYDWGMDPKDDYQVGYHHGFSEGVQRGVDERYPVMPPDWFDPANAGERWSDDW